MIHLILAPFEVPAEVDGAKESGDRQDDEDGDQHKRHSPVKIFVKLFFCLSNLSYIKLFNIGPRLLDISDKEMGQPRPLFFIFSSFRTVLIFFTILKHW